MVPAVNQIEVHPYFTNEAARGRSRDAGILVEAWSPIAQGGVLDDATIVKIAEHVGRTPAQVTLRWHIQRGDIVFPKSSTPERMAENFALFDFELDDQAMDVDHRPRPWRGRPHRPEPGHVRLHPRLIGSTSFRRRTKTGAVLREVLVAPRQFHNPGCETGAAQSIVTRITLLPCLVWGSKTRKRLSPLRPVMM